MFFVIKSALFCSILWSKPPNPRPLPTFRAVKLSKKNIFSLILALFCLAIHWAGRHPLWVENAYSQGFFLRFSAAFRWMLGAFPFSVGDLLYGIWAGWLVWKSVVWVKRWYAQRQSLQFYVSAIQSAWIFGASLYLLFNICWGLNYNRKGIAWQMGFHKEKYSLQDLDKINSFLLSKANHTKELLDQQHYRYPSNQQLFRRAILAYDSLTPSASFVNYAHPCVKSSLWGWLGNYLGFSGYYNPFTGEAQVNTEMPPFLQPFVSCHEIAHQLGYAKESEASFVGYLAAVASNDTLFQYAAYLDVFVSANVNLYAVDSLSAIRYRNQLSPAVHKDLKQWMDFNEAHQNPIEPMINWVYDKYLKGNEQQQGMMSYNQVTALLIAYYKNQKNNHEIKLK